VERDVGWGWAGAAAGGRERAPVNLGALRRRSRGGAPLGSPGGTAAGRAAGKGGGRSQQRSAEPPYSRSLPSTDWMTPPSTGHAATPWITTTLRENALTQEETHMKIGRLAVWALVDCLTASAEAAFARAVEQWGYSALWTGEALGRDVLVNAAWLLANTRTLGLSS